MSGRPGRRRRRSRPRTAETPKAIDLLKQVVRTPPRPQNPAFETGGANNALHLHPDRSLQRRVHRRQRQDQGDVRGEAADPVPGRRRQALRRAAGLPAAADAAALAFPYLSVSAVDAFLRLKARRSSRRRPRPRSLLTLTLTYDNDRWSRRRNKKPAGPPAEDQQPGPDATVACDEDRHGDPISTSVGLPPTTLPEKDVADHLQRREGNRDLGRSVADRSPEC